MQICQLFKPHFSDIFLWKGWNRKFSRIFKDSLGLKYLSNWDSKGAKRSAMNSTMNTKKCFPKIFCLVWTVGCQKFLHYIRMIYLGCFNLKRSVWLFNIFLSISKDHFCISWSITAFNFLPWKSNYAHNFVKRPTLSFSKLFKACQSNLNLTRKRFYGYFWSKNIQKLPNNIIFIWILEISLIGYVTPPDHWSKNRNFRSPSVGSR